MADFSVSLNQVKQEYLILFNIVFFWRLFNLTQIFGFKLDIVKSESEKV